MTDEGLKILRMLEEGKITAEEGARLFEAVDGAFSSAQGSMADLSEGGRLPTQRKCPMTTMTIQGKSLQGRAVSICVDGKPVDVTPQSQEDGCVSIEVTGDLANLYIAS